MDTGSSSSSPPSLLSSSSSAAPGDVPRLDGPVNTVEELEERLRLAQAQLAQNTRRTFLFVPFSPEECAAPKSVLEDARRIAETTGLRKLSVDLYRADAAENTRLGLPEPPSIFRKQDLVDRFNQYPDKPGLLLHAAARVPILLQYPGPEVDTPQPRPGPADRVFIHGHGHFGSDQISSHTVPLTAPQPDPGDDWLTSSDDERLTGSDDDWLTPSDEEEPHEALPGPVADPGTDISPQEIIARMRATGIPDQIGKINLLCCGGSTTLHPAFVQACQGAGAYPNVPVTAYGKEGVNNAIVIHLEARHQLDMGLLSIMEADDLLGSQEFQSILPGILAGLEHLDDQLATAKEQQKEAHEKAGTPIPPLPPLYPPDDLSDDLSESLSDSDDEGVSPTADIDELVADLHTQIQRTEATLDAQAIRIEGRSQPASLQKVRDTIRPRPDDAGLRVPVLDLPPPAAAAPAPDAAPAMLPDAARASPRLRDSHPHLDRSRSPDRSPKPTPDDTTTSSQHTFG